jgi:hypothetical protein
MNRSQVQKALKQRFHAENYFGRVDLTIAKQVYASSPTFLGAQRGFVVEQSRYWLAQILVMEKTLLRVTKI